MSVGCLSSCLRNENVTKGIEGYVYTVGLEYVVTIADKKKSDFINATKYEYDEKNQLVSYTDPEGRAETYTYIVESIMTMRRKKCISGQGITSR